MHGPEPVALAVVGAAGRGASFRPVIDAIDGVRVRAVCDIREDALTEARGLLGAESAYTDYEEMLETGRVDAVLIGTPMPLHVPQSIAALERGIHVLSEVPAGVSIKECKDLVRAAKAGAALYAMAENYIHPRFIALVTALVRAGLFGDTYYAEGEYLHELKELNETTPWRRKWQTGIDGITYPTHSLGPILEWMPGDRVVEVCCAGSGHHYRDPRGDLYENQDSVVMLCRMASGGLAKVRVDMLSDRPHAMNNYQLQGTDGAFESARAPGERHRIWLRALNPERDRWLDLMAIEKELASYLPAGWREDEAAAQAAGHGGGDYYVVADFVNAIRQGKQPAVGIHRAMDMTLPGLVSQQSILENGRWLPVPDSRDW
jgi:predicted dehydrogenase